MAAPNINPLGDRVVIEPSDEAEEMRGGLYIPDTAKEKPQQGKVVAVGPGRLNDEGNRVAPDVAVDDVVLYGKYAGTEVSVGGNDYVIVRSDDILATL